MKRLLCTLLVLALALPTIACTAASGRQVCTAFLTAISQGDYDAAYDLLDPAVQADPIQADSENPADIQATRRWPWKPRARSPGNGLSASIRTFSTC